MIPGPESIPESDFEHFSEFHDSNSNSNSCKNRFLYCTGIDSKIQYFVMAMIPIPIPIPEKNGIITPMVVWSLLKWLVLGSVNGRRKCQF